MPESMESESPPPPPAAAVTRSLPFLFINILLLIVGTTGGPLIMRLYFIHGGKRIWFSSWLQTAGWPIILIPLFVDYTRRRRNSPAVAKLILMNSRVFLAAGFIGVLTGLDNYLYTYGVAKLPVSTSSLIIATQLAFTAVFTFFIVKQRFTSYSINAVVLLSTGAAVLGLHMTADQPEGESHREYVLGFILTVAAAALYGLILPLVELTYMKSNQVMSYTVVLEFQLVMCFFSTAFCTIGMVINRDFPAIGREVKSYELGESIYYVVVVFTSVILQCCFLGIIGVIFYSSSLLSGIIISISLPLTEILAVIFFHERFQAEKGVSLFLSIWGFVSYFYGEHKSKRRGHHATGEYIQHKLSSSSV